MTLEKEIQKRREAYDQIRRERLQPAYDWIVANATKRKPMSNAAKMVDMDQMSFATNFRRVFKISPKELATKIQIDLAKELMLKGISMHRVWHQCGFSSSQHLGDRFRHVTGTTIRQWKRENGL